MLFVGVSNRNFIIMASIRHAFSHHISDRPQFSTTSGVCLFICKKEEQKRQIHTKKHHEDINHYNLEILPTFLRLEQVHLQDVAKN